MRVIGIDPGIRCSGYGIVENSGGNRIQLIEAGTIRPPARDKFSQKLAFLYQRFFNLFQKYPASQVIIEEAFFAANPRTALVLGHARGVIMVAAINNKMEVFEYSPRKIKMALAGYGNASKRQVAFMVQKIIGENLDKLPADATDALAAAICHLNQNKIVGKS